MMLSLLAAPDSLPITLEEAKDHARVEVDADDALITGLIGAATNYAEWYTSRALMPQEWELRLDTFPACRWIDVPRPPLISGEEVAYLDSSGVEQVFDAANYRVITVAGPFAEKGRIALREGKSWPTAAREPASVFVRFTAGYSEEVPEQAKTALREHVAELYENRESTVLTGAIMQEVPFSVNQLLWPFVVDKIL